MKFGITSHTIVKNEEKFIKFALLSVIAKMDKMLVWDTGSTDQTVNLIKSLKNKKIEFRECGKVDRKKLVLLRNEQLKLTKTSWFLILDGDEIWPQENLVKLIEAMKKAKKQTIALVNKTRNCLGDLYHYLPDEEGKYKIGPWQGHLNIRAIRNLEGLRVAGSYPLETYLYRGIPIQNLTSRLEFVETWYLHTTHLQRSRWQHQVGVIDRIKKYKFIWRKKVLKMKKEELPSVLNLSL